MSPVAIGLDLLLAMLLLGALAMGWRLNGRLKALRASQADFAKAVTELDTAAMRAEAGLTALRAAAEEAHDSLLARIDTARALALKLEKAEASAEGAARRAEAAAAEAKAIPARAEARPEPRAEPRLSMSRSGLRELLDGGPAPDRAAPASREPVQPSPRRRNVADETLFVEAENDVRPSLQGLMRLSLNGRR